MAERVREAAVAMRHEIEWGRWQSGVSHAVAKLAAAELYSIHGRVRRAHIERVRQELVRAVTQTYFRDAMDAGRRAAEPILRGLEGRSLKLRTAADVRRALRMRGNAAKWHRREINAIRAQFALELKAASSSLSPTAEAVFMRARRDAATQGKGVRGLAHVLARADRSTLRSGLRRRQKVREATKVLRDAERSGDEAATVAGRAALATAKRNAARSRAYTFVERFEVQAQAAARNSVRRVAQKSQMAYYKNAGYGANALFTYVASNGTDACPSCEERHGVTQKEKQWDGQGPAEDTYCGDACCCQLVPAGYAASNQSLERPLSLDLPKGAAGPPTPTWTVAGKVRRPPKGGFEHLASKPKPSAKPKPSSKRKAPKPKRKPRGNT